MHPIMDPSRIVKVVYQAEIDKHTEQLKDERKRGLSPAQRLPTLTALRKLLKDSLLAEDLHWFTLDLKKGQRASRAEYTVKVCSPVFIAGYFVPVTARETWDLAAKYDVLPLTRAVADQQVNEAADRSQFIEFISQPYDTHLPAFDEYAEKLKATKYASASGTSPVSGSHKLWLLSSRATDQKPVNYGFHHHGKRLPGSDGNPGKYLYSSYSVVNGLIRAHNWPHWWDYSQLLQFMKDLRDKDGKVLNLRQVLIDKDHPARSWVWDELLVLSAAMLPKKA